VTVTRQYDPYGVQLQGAAASGYALTGRECDAEIGLYYYRARYYDPAIVAFVSSDPAGFSVGSNFYKYVDGRPGAFRDPFGLGPQEAVLAWGQLSGGSLTAAAAVLRSRAALLGPGAAVISTAAGGWAAGG